MLRALALVLLVTIVLVWGAAMVGGPPLLLQQPRRSLHKRGVVNTTTTTTAKENDVDDDDADAQRFMLYVQQLQRQRRRRGVVWRGHDAGLGSHINVMVVALLESVLMGKRFAIASGARTPYVHPKRCASRLAWPCIYRALDDDGKDGESGDGKKAIAAIPSAIPFRAPSLLPSGDAAISCTAHVTLDAASHTLLADSTVAAAAGITTQYCDSWYSAQLLKWAMRPAPPLTALVAHLKNVELKWPLNSAHKVIGVHIRHTDKSEGPQHPTWAYAEVAAHLVRKTGARHVFLASDDRAALASFPGELAKRSGVAAVRTMVIPPSYFASLSSRCNSTTLKMGRNERPVGCVPGVEVAHAQHKLALPRVGDVVFDEGLTMSAMVELMSRTDAVVGTLSSNVGQLIQELARARGHTSGSGASGGGRSPCAAVETGSGQFFDMDGFALGLTCRSAESRDFDPLHRPWSKAVYRTRLAALRGAVA